MTCGQILPTFRTAWLSGTEEPLFHEMVFDSAKQEKKHCTGPLSVTQPKVSKSALMPRALFQAGMESEERCIARTE